MFMKYIPIPVSFHFQFLIESQTDNGGKKSINTKKRSDHPVLSVCNTD